MSAALPVSSICSPVGSRRLVPIHFPQDPGPAGKDIGFLFKQRYQREGYTVVVEPVRGKKTERANPFSVVVNTGRFYVVVNDITPDDPKAEKGPYLSPEQVKQ